MDNWCGNSRRAIDGRRSISTGITELLGHMSDDNRLFAAAHMLPRARCGSKSLAEVPQLGGGSAHTVGQSYGTDHLHER